MKKETFIIYSKDKKPIAVVKGKHLVTEDEKLQKLWDSKPKLISGGEKNGLLYTEERAPKNPEEAAQAFIERVIQQGMLVKRK